MPFKKRTVSAKYPLYLFGGHVKVWLKREGDLRKGDTSESCVKKNLFLWLLHCYVAFTIPSHLKSAPVILDKVIVHSADHPFVFIQDLCLQREKKHGFNNTRTTSPRDIFRANTRHWWELTGCMLISQPVFSPGSFKRSKPKRASISSVNWLRSSRLRADMDEPSSLVETKKHNKL